MKGNGNGTHPPKTAPKTVGRPFVPGVDARRGGGKAGRSGRKPDDFKAKCEGLADNEILSAVTAYLRKKPKVDDPWFWKCAEYATSYGKGKPLQPVAGPGGGPVVVRIIREEFDRGD